MACCLSTLSFSLSGIVDRILPCMGYNMISGSYEPKMYMVLNLRITEVVCSLPHGLPGRHIEECCPFFTPEREVSRGETGGGEWRGLPGQPWRELLTLSNRGIKWMSFKKELLHLGKISEDHSKEPPTRNTPEAGAWSS